MKLRCQAAVAAALVANEPIATRLAFHDADVRSSVKNGLKENSIQSNPGVAAYLFDHLVRPRQHVRRYRQADLFGGLQVDHQLELRRLFLTGSSAGFAPLRILST